MKRKLLVVAALCLLAVLAGLGWVCFGPAPIDPVAYHPPESHGFVDEFAVNDRLSEAEILPIQNGVGPEDVAVDAQGRSGDLIGLADTLNAEGLGEFSVIGRPSPGGDQAPTGDPGTNEPARGFVPTGPLGDEPG